jgi:ribonuclease HI
MADVVIYTDGSLNREEQLLTSSFWVEHENYGVTVRHMETDPVKCTNIRAELEAIYLAVYARLAPSTNLVIKTDCQCLVKAWDGMTRRNIAATRYAHTDLWQDMLEHYQNVPESTLTLEWVKGHSTSVGNILVDRACRAWLQTNTQYPGSSDWHWYAACPTSAQSSLLTTLLKPFGQR